VFKPRFSVIIPAYNSETTLLAAVDSVLGQTVEDFELLVIDDGSTDATRALMQSIVDPRVQRIYQDNRGVSAARNAGFGSSQGEIVTFLDSDDWACPGWLAEFGSLMASEDVGVGFCGMLALEPDGMRREVLPKGIASARTLFLAGCYAVRRTLLLEVAGFDERLNYSENTDLGFRLLRACKRAGLRTSATDKVLVTSNRPHLSRHTTATRLEHQIAAVRILMDKHADMFGCDPGSAADYLAVAGVAAARLGHLSEARGFFRQAIRRHPRRTANYARLVAALSPWTARRAWSTLQR